MRRTETFSTQYKRIADIPLRISLHVIVCPTSYVGITQIRL